MIGADVDIFVVIVAAAVAPIRQSSQPLFLAKVDFGLCRSVVLLLTLIRERNEVCCQDILRMYVYYLVSTLVPFSFPEFFQQSLCLC